LAPYPARGYTSTQIGTSRSTTRRTRIIRGFRCWPLPPRIPIHTSQVFSCLPPLDVDVDSSGGGRSRVLLVATLSFLDQMFVFGHHELVGAIGFEADSVWEL